MDYVFISDFFIDDILGGGEINDDVVIKELVKKGHNVIKIKSQFASIQLLKANKKKNFIISNFLNLSQPSKKYIENNCSYIIYEHDHKYLRTRNPAIYEHFLAPDSHIINRTFYKNALAVFCQSKFHCNIVRKNLVIDNIKNIGGNAWSDESLSIIKSMADKDKKDIFSVMNSNIQHKNTQGAVDYCVYKKEEYELIKDDVYHYFLEKMSNNKKIAFFPKTPETLSRVLVEARMMGMQVHTNSNVGATYEKWFSMKGEELIDFMSKKRKKIVKSIEEIFQERKCSFFLDSNNKKVSIITSLYKGDDHIESFLEQITLQTYFDKCELIIIDANSPGDEFEVIKKYMEKFNNISYEKLEKDPGIYGCWNKAIQKSKGEYITNANLDDRRSLQQIEIFVNELEEDKSIDLVYSECFVTHEPNETYSNNTADRKTYPISDFSKENMIKCLPGCMPVWRKSLHDKCGMFDESYKFAGDWEMWLRFVSNGHSFKKVDGVYGLYYHNPKGLTTDVSRQRQKYAEEVEVFNQYKDIFGDKNYQKYKGYFSQ